jgi:hypothetical protein
MHPIKSQTLVLGMLADKPSRRALNVAWISPLEQDIYGPGATILSKWASVEMIDSPCFKLCMASPSNSRHSVGDRSTGNCGATVCPAVTESAGVYQAPVSVPSSVHQMPQTDFTCRTVPDVPSNEDFYLQMEDRFGTRMRSPVFTLSRESR